MTSILKNLAGAAFLLGCWFAEVYATKGTGALAETHYMSAWCVWVGGPVVFGLINRDAFQGVDMQLRLALVLFLAALLTVLLYVLGNPLLFSFAAGLRRTP